MGQEKKTKTQLIQELTECRKDAARLRAKEERLAKASRVLMDMESRYRSLFENMRAAALVFYSQDDGRSFMLKDMNRAAQDLDRLDPEKHLGKPVLDIFPNFHKKHKLLEIFQRIWKSGRAEHFPLRLYKGKRIRGWREYFIYKLPTGEIVAVYEDLTAVKLALAEVRKLYQAVEQSPSTVVITDTDGLIEYVNKRFEDTAGVGRGEVIGRHVDAIRAKNTPGEIYDQMWKTLRSGQTWRGEFHDLSAAGQDIWERAVIFPVKDDDGNPSNFIGIKEDITERKAVLRELEVLARFPNENPQPVMRIDRNGTVLYANDPARERLGVEPGEAAPEEWREHFLAALSGRPEQETEHRVRGRVFALTFSSNPGHDDANVYGRDVTEVHRALDDLGQSEARFRMLVERMQEGLVVMDREGRIDYANQRFSEIVGLDRYRLIGRPVQAALGPEYAPCLSETPGESPKKPYEFTFKTGRGESSSVMISPAPMFDENGALTGSFAVVTDMTEARLMEKKLLQAQKLESIGQLAAGIAHEINTPAQYVGSNLKFLKDVCQGINRAMTSYGRLLKELKQGAVSEEALEAADRAAEKLGFEDVAADITDAVNEALDGVGRISDIVQSVKRFAHPGHEEITPVDINAAITNTITMSRNEWKYVAEMKTDLDTSLPPAPCVPGELNQFILNLITNAAHAITEKLGDDPAAKGSIEISTRLNKGGVEIRVKDSGGGVPKDIQGRIFDPFFTTKAVGKGSGQGLSIARTQISERLGGEISFETTAGEGTTFIIRLPLQQDTPGQ
ncbi:MAG: PAS domain S-box protein [Desulfovibrionaceae bacterium]|nr:PAS domain S-box protein [Desulfovibrionaceae bacterium]